MSQIDISTVDHIVGCILDRLDRAGDGYSGLELVTQRVHALQCGLLAERAGAPSSLVAAAFLHDIGHLLQNGVASLAIQGIDALHEEKAATFLETFFPDSVVEPVRLHVRAKRYLCTTERGYFESLSTASITSLMVQGGPFNEVQADKFLKQPFAHEAIALRRWDDLAKDPKMRTPDIAYFAYVLQDNVLQF
ncbi:MAG: HD domain-containing protein [Rhodospirillaceae bacterium]|jgi:[1-hydroxy-2-(trimethylamino)ethyl]phosphonate dioxygenase|nr:HD domain-containing protein [Rhodospirillaceae bacterium]MBT7758718.1 HD domain-containing protein [Rhodospirillaceae bacterium]